MRVESELARAAGGAARAEAEPARFPLDGGAPDASRWPRRIFVTLLAIAAAPLWLVRHLPTQDGANHVETVMALLRLPSSPLLQHHYLAQLGLQPNWLTQVLLAALVQLVSPALAERLLLTGYVVLLPLAFRLALPRSPRAAWAALAVFPFVHSFAFHMGLWNFTYSLILFLLTLGVWHRTRGRLSPARGVAVAALLVLLYFAHSVTTSAALGSMAVLLAWRGGLATWRCREDGSRRARVVRGYLRRAAATAAAAAPATALLVAFALRQPSTPPVRLPLLDQAKHLATAYALVSFDLRELAGTVPVALGIGLTVVLALRGRGRRRLHAADGWLAAAALAAAACLAMPDAVNDGAQISDRLALFPYLLALAWIALAGGPARRVRALGIALAVAFVALTAFRLARYREIDGYLADYATVTAHVAQGSTLLPLTFAPYGPRQGGRPDGEKLLSYRVGLFQHAAGYVVTERHGVDLDNSQANTRHAPLRWRDELNPFRLLGTRRAGLEDEPPCAQLWPYAAAGERIDYVLVWGATPAAAATACGARLARELAEGWERVFVSPRGLAELYRPRPGAAPARR